MLGIIPIESGPVVVWGSCCGPEAKIVPLVILANGGRVTLLSLELVGSSTPAPNAN